MTNFDAIDPAVKNAESTVGPIDVLINNAGYGHEGTLEESSLDDLRRQFDVNVFAAVAVIKAVIPHMRRRRGGHIIDITSIGGLAAMPGVAYYCGSKFALEGISEALGKEIAGFGIKVTAVAPGSFRTDWVGRSMVRSERTIADYDVLFDPIRRAHEEKSGKQSGDPARAAAAILGLAGADDAPAHLLLGSDAMSIVKEKLTWLTSDIIKWERVTRSTDFQ